MAHDAVSHEGEDVRQGVIELKAHVSEALKLADRLSMPPELGARLQELLDLVDDNFSG